VQPEGEQQAGSTPAKGRPEALFPPAARLKRLWQRIQQTLSQGHALTQPTGLQAFVARRQPLGPADLGHQSSQLVKPADWRVGRARTLLHGVRMTWCRDIRPVPASSNAHEPASPRDWPPGSQEAARELHGRLRIGDRDWHALKSQPQRRAAEQLAAALVQLLDPANAPGAASSGPQRQEAAALVEHALGWLKGERRDPGCPSHGR